MPVLLGFKGGTLWFCSQISHGASAPPSQRTHCNIFIRELVQGEGFDLSQVSPQPSVDATALYAYEDSKLDVRPTWVWERKCRNTETQPIHTHTRQEWALANYAFFGARPTTLTISRVMLAEIILLLCSLPKLICLLGLGNDMLQ